MKDFKDFVKTLTEEKLIEICDKCNQQHMKVSLPKDDVGVSDFMEKTLSLNLVVTLEVLKLYHEWLHQ